MNRYRQFLVSVFLLCLPASGSLAQSISGYVYDENNAPIPFASVFFKELANGTATNEKGHYYLSLDPGVYTVVYSSVGYQPQTVQVVVGDDALEKDIRLAASTVKLDEIVVKAGKKDPAYEIIQHVIDNKQKFLSQVKSFRTEVYVRATEVVDPKKKKAPVKAREDDLSQAGPPPDPFAEARKKEQAQLENINLLEMQLVLNYRHPDQYKEERTGFKAYGDKQGLFVPVFSEADFNFYYNLVDLKGIAEVPVISPVSRFAILSYKYKLEETTRENGRFVYKIRVTPRKTGDATCRGYVYVNDSTWNLNRLELSLDKGGLKFYDAFTIRQTYQQVEADLWIPARQEFVYETRGGGRTFRGNTVWVYNDYRKDYPFPPRFFGNEVSVITKEAYERDSAYWNRTRTEPLTLDQRKVIAYRDSIEAVHKSKAYIDSVEARFNKVTVGEVLYHGVGFRKEASKRSIFIGPLFNLLRFEVIGGFRLGPFASYFRKFNSGRMINTSGTFSVGFRNRDWNGNLSVWTRYNPYHLGDAAVRVGRSFYSINSFDAYLNQLSISNYILHEHVDAFHRIELFNGFYLTTELGFHNRHSVDDYDRTSILNRVLEEDEPLGFENYQALISTLKVAYTPGQKFMSEPNQKVVLGSKYPTFSIAHRKGWNGLLTSDVDFDYVEGSIEQNLQLGTLGNSRYALMAGKYLNTRNLHLVDLKRFRQSDPYLYSDPLHSFQLLDTALSTTNVFLEAHYIHHFNGAMINNLPFIKKTRIRTVAGAGAMWIQESGYRHTEIFGGVERIFKLGPRRRLRLGIYGVAAQTNRSAPTTGYKISFDVIDTWKRDWSY